MIAATILSAGRSTRMGHPKARLLYRGRTFLQGILEAAEAAGLRRIVAVGADAAEILSGHDLRGVSVVTNTEMDSGPIGSIRAAIREIRDDPVEAILVWPVDLPHVSVKTIELLREAFSNTGGPIVLPVYRGTRGHPVIFGRPVFAELLDTSLQDGARDVVHRDTSRVVEVEVEDSAVVSDLNTPEEYEGLLRLEDRHRGKEPD